MTYIERRQEEKRHDGFHKIVNYKSNPPFPTFTCQIYFNQNKLDINDFCGLDWSPVLPVLYR